jgi:hypothetical protein
MGQHDTGLQMEEHARFQAREWRAERIGWAAMALLVVLAVLGVFAGGPLSRTTEESASGLVVEYDRLQRLDGEGEITVRMPTGAASSGTVALLVSQDWLSAVQLEQVSPEPAAQVFSGEQVAFQFDAADDTRPLHVTLDFRPKSVGASVADFALAGEEPVRIRQFCYP